MSERTVEMATLPLSRLHSMLTTAHRRGAEQERMGEIGGYEDGYALAEHHARKLIDAFVEGGHVEVATEAYRTPTQEDKEREDGS